MLRSESLEESQEIYKYKEYLNIYLNYLHRVCCTREPPRKFKPCKQHTTCRDIDRLSHSVLHWLMHTPSQQTITKSNLGSDLQEDLYEQCVINMHA